MTPSPGRAGLPAWESLRQRHRNPGPAVDGGGERQRLGECPRKASYGGGEATQWGRKVALVANPGKPAAVALEAREAEPTWDGLAARLPAAVAAVLEAQEAEPPFS